MIKIFEILKSVGPFTSFLIAGIYMYYLGTTRSKKGWNPTIKERIKMQRIALLLIIVGILIGVFQEVNRIAGLF